MSKRTQSAVSQPQFGEDARIVAELHTWPALVTQNWQTERQIAYMKRNAISTGKELSSVTKTSAAVCHVPRVAISAIIHSIHEVFGRLPLDYKAKLVLRRSSAVIFAAVLSKIQQTGG